MTQKGLGTTEPLELPAIVITPDRMQNYGPGGGGGYEGDGSGWGLQEGPPREQDELDSDQRTALREFSFELQQRRTTIYNDYVARSRTNLSDAILEVAEKTRLAREKLPVASIEYFTVEQNVTVEVINDKRPLLNALAPKMYGMFSQSPYYLLESMAQVMMLERLKAGAATPEELAKISALHDEIYASALEFDDVSTQIDFIAGTLALKASVIDRVAANTPPDETRQTHRLAQIIQERDVQFKRLPECLQVEVLESAGSVVHLSVAEALVHYKNTMEALATRKLAAVGPIVGPPSYSHNGVTHAFPATNQQVQPPLSAPKLQALFELVYLQVNTSIGHMWQSHHDAVLKKESARHLTQAAASIEQLADRASDTEQTMTALTFVSNFMKEVTEKFGVKASAAAKKLASEAQGPRLRNAQQALAAYERNKDILNKKFSVKDRQAIANALDALDLDMMGKNLKHFSRVFASANDIKDYSELLIEFGKALRSDSWKPFFVKAETIFGGKFVTAVSARAAVWFFGLLSTLIGAGAAIVGFALFMALLNTWITDDLVSELNDFIMSLADANTEKNQPLPA